MRWWDVGRATHASPHGLLNALNDPNAAFPCADAALIAPIKKSPEYRTVRPRLAGPAPVDSWEDEGLHYFAFQMKPEDGAADGAEPPVALFTMRRDETDRLASWLSPSSRAAITPWSPTCATPSRRSMCHWADPVQCNSALARSAPSPSPNPEGTRQYLRPAAMGEWAWA